MAKKKRKLPKNKRIARRLSNDIIKAEKRDLRDQSLAIHRGAANDRRDALQAYERGRGDLEYVRGETDDFLTGMNQKNADMYSGMKNTQQAATTALRGELNSTYSNAQAGANEELARLGIPTGGNFSQMSADAGFSDAQAQQAGANATGTMDLNAANASMLGGMLRSMNQGSFNANSGKNLNAYNDARKEILRNRNDQISKVRQGQTDLSRRRGEVFFQILQSLRK